MSAICYFIRRKRTAVRSQLASLLSISPLHSQQHLRTNSLLTCNNSWDLMIRDSRAFTVVHRLDVFCCCCCCCCCCAAAANDDDDALRSSLNIRITWRTRNCIDELAKIRSSVRTRSRNSRRTSRRWYWRLTTTITRSFRCFYLAITRSRDRIRSPASAPTASPSRTTTLWNGPARDWTPTEHWPVPRIWRCRVPIPSWQRLNCDRRWRHSLKLKRNSK